MPMRKSTKAIAILLLLIMTFSACATSVFGAGIYYYDNDWHTHPEKTLRIMINGRLINTPIPPLLFGDRSVVPARSVMEELGATVTWLGETSQVFIALNNTKILLTINSTTAYINDVPAKMEIAPKIVNGNTMIPVRFVSENLDFDVGFDSVNSIITINDKPKPATIAGITYKKSGEDLIIQFSASDSVTFESFTMTNPTRLVIDVFNAKITKDTSYPINIGKVSAVRIANHPDKVRLVIDFNEFCQTEIKVADNRSFSVTAKNAAPAATPTPKPTVAPTKTPNPDPDSNLSDATSKPVATPSPTPAPTPEPYIVMPPIVILDPGHGGSDPGALGKKDGEVVLEEADVNLDIALRVRDILVAKGVNVMMTRTKDTFVPLDDLSALANKNGAYLYISIHSNAIDSPEVSGTMVLSYITESSGSAYAISSKELGAIVLDELMKEIDTDNKGQRDGSKMSVIRKTNMPAIIVEVAFLTNEEDLARLMDDDFRQKAATGIANGILRALELVDKRLSE